MMHVQPPLALVCSSFFLSRSSFFLFFFLFFAVDLNSGNRGCARLGGEMALPFVVASLFSLPRKDERPKPDHVRRGHGLFDRGSPI